MEGVETQFTTSECCETHTHHTELAEKIKRLIAGVLEARVIFLALDYMHCSSTSLVVVMRLSLHV